MRVNEYLANMPAAYLFAEIDSRVAAYRAAHPGREVLRLGIGDVTLPLSRHVAQAFADAALGMATREGFVGYPPGQGCAFLREAICRHDYAARGANISPDEIFISDGAKTDTAALQELFGRDTRVAFTDPVYPVYVDASAMAGRLGTYQDGRWSRAVYLPTTAENGFVPDVPGGDVDVLYLCCPNNPTGTALNRVQLKRFVDWARAGEKLIVFDAAYKAFIQDEGVPRTIYEIEGADEVAIECCSFSKTAGFTGVRCAYTVVPKKLMGTAGGRRVSLHSLWARRGGSKCNGVSYPVQKAACAVFDRQGMQEAADNVRYYMGNAALIREGLRRGGLTVFGGQNAPYIWLKTPGGMGSWDFFDLLLERAQVVGTPGAGFGLSGEGYFRLTAFGARETAAEATERILNTL